MAKQVKQTKDQDKMTRIVFDRPVKEQRGDIYKILSKGTCVEYTDKLREAEAAYKECSLPKEMYKVSRLTGNCIKLRQDIM
jgi:hypothetical protein